MIKITDFPYPYRLHADIDGNEYSDKITELISYHLDVFMRTTVGRAVLVDMQTVFDGTDFATEKYQRLFFGYEDFEGLKKAAIPYLFHEIIQELPIVYADGGLMQATKENLYHVNNSRILQRAYNESTDRIGGKDFTSTIDYGTSVYNYLDANASEFPDLKFNYLRI